MNERIYLSPPHLGGSEMSFIKDAMDTNWVAPIGPNITNFENELGSYLHGSKVAALSSGTAAIHLALIVLGVKKNDEVICSSFTFSGSCNPIAYLDAKPVFVDSERETWNIDPDLLKFAIDDRIAKTGKKPAAIIVVHLYGMPAKMDEIMNIAQSYSIPVVEDAAEALGSSYKGRKCGTLSNIGILSFNGNKIITTSGGGALISNSEECIGKTKFLATQARDPAPYYQHTEIGYNYRLSNICAGIGRGQLEILEERVLRRRAIFLNYYENLKDYGVQFQPEIAHSYSNRWLSCIIFEKSTIQGDKIRQLLDNENIESRPLWKPMHLQPVFAKAPSYVNGVSEELFAQGLCLPSGTNMSEEQQNRIIDLITNNL